MAQQCSWVQHTECPTIVTSVVMNGTTSQRTTLLDVKQTTVANTMAQPDPR